MAEDRKATEAAIADVLQARLMAWNAGDLEGYHKLLTDDADVVSATGRKSGLGARTRSHRPVRRSKSGNHRTGTATITATEIHASNPAW